MEYKLIYILSVILTPSGAYHTDAAPLDMLEDGKRHYELLHERTKLPKYGECWKNAIEKVNTGCKFLSEDTQSDMALHVTNCFLEMSGHETYNCEHDKKPNLRRICISTMSDRAFNAYTQFYTHMQNICYFIRGQIWQEKIFEGTIKVGEQLTDSIDQQKLLIEQQKLSLELQKRIIDNGRLLENVLNESRVRAEYVMGELRNSVQNHQKLLGVVVNSLSALQNWLIGEVSWIDSIAFYFVTGASLMFLTSAKRTSRARLPVLLVLCVEMVCERLLCAKLTDAHVTELEINVIHQNLRDYVDWGRHICIVLCVIVISTFAFKYCDLNRCNYEILVKIDEKNERIQRVLDKLDGFMGKEDKTDVLDTPTVVIHRYNLRQKSQTPLSVKQ